MPKELALHKLESRLTPVFLAQLNQAMEAAFSKHRATMLNVSRGFEKAKALKAEADQIDTHEIDLGLALDLDGLKEKRHSLNVQALTLTSRLREQLVDSEIELASTYYNAKATALLSVSPDTPTFLASLPHLGREAVGLTDTETAKDHIGVLESEWQSKAWAAEEERLSETAEANTGLGAESAIEGEARVSENHTPTLLAAEPDQQTLAKDRTSRLSAFCSKHGCKEADVWRSAGDKAGVVVHRADGTRWKKGILREDSAMSERIEKVLNGEYRLKIGP